MDASLQSLMDLGFTQLEAEVYVLLAQDSPATGYRVAQALGRPVAGIYRTLESLANKGAVVLDDGDNRLSRAVPPAELLSRLDREFQERKRSAAAGLAALKPPADDDRVYQLRSAEQVFERARVMLGRCIQLTLIDALPGPISELRPDLQAAIDRGLRVAIQAYEKVEFPGAMVTHFDPNHELVQGFPGQWVFLVIDGSEMLIAFLSSDCRQVMQAIWTASPYLAHTLQAFMASEFILVGAMNDPEFPPEARAILRRQGAFIPRPIPGFQRLLERLGISPPTNGKPDEEPA